MIDSLVQDDQEFSTAHADLQMLEREYAVIDEALQAKAEWLANPSYDGAGHADNLSTALAVARGGGAGRSSGEEMEAAQREYLDLRRRFEAVQRGLPLAREMVEIAREHARVRMLSRCAVRGKIRQRFVRALADLVAAMREEDHLLQAVAAAGYGSSDHQVTSLPGVSRQEVYWAADHVD